MPTVHGLHGAYYIYAMQSLNCLHTAKELEILIDILEYLERKASFFKMDSII